MAIILDANGTPTPIYPREGTTIDQIDADEETQPTDIVTISSHAIVVVRAGVVSGDPNLLKMNVRLPADAQIGDVVEIYPAGLPGSGFGQDPSCWVYPHVGGRINERNTDALYVVESMRIFRKFSATQWRV